MRSILNCLAALTLGSTSAFCSGSSASDNGLYPQFCYEAAANSNTFATFKRNPIYTQILEHVSYEYGKSYLNIALEQTPRYLNLLEQFRQNDSLGKPIVFSYGQFGYFSPTTLRYMKVASDLETQFGNLDGFNIIEIGGGYGGQCKVLSTLFKLNHYTIVDLPGPLALTAKYLAEHGITNVSLLTLDELPEGQHYDLVISNYAFSECIPTVQFDYFDKVIRFAENGYMTCNISPETLPKTELIAHLKSLHSSTTESHEAPLTYEHNYLLTWNR